MRLIITTDRALSESSREYIRIALKSAGVEAIILDGGLKAQGEPESRRERVARSALAGILANPYNHGGDPCALAREARIAADALLEGFAK